MRPRPALHLPDSVADAPADVRHDARNLLQVVGGYLELIAGRARDPLVQRYVANARVATGQLVALAEHFPGATDNPEL